MKTALDLAAPVEKAGRMTDYWGVRPYALNDWRESGLLPGEYLLDVLRENA